MNNFEQLVQESYESLIRKFSFANITEVNPKSFDKVPETVLDKESLRQLEIYELFKAVNYTTTRVGAHTLYRSLNQPLASLDLILEKQKSLKEIKENTELRDALKRLLHEIKEGEENFFEFIEGFFVAMNAGIDYRLTGSFVKKAVSSSKELPNAETTYLKTLIDKIQDFENTDAFKLFRGPVYRTIGGFKPKEKVSFLTPSIKLSYSTNVTAWLPLAYSFGGIASLSDSLPKDEFRSYMMTFVMLAMASIYFGCFAPNIFNYKVFYKPLSKYLHQNEDVQDFIDIYGKIDELISFYEFAQAMQNEKNTKMATPIVKDSEQYYFIGKQIKNPILAKTIPNYVPNDIELKGGIPVIVTGPNSGGKTTLGKTIAQLNILAQIGSDVPAEEGTEMAIADRIFYQYYMPDILAYSEGDFGSNLARTRDIFYNSTPKSLIILNTLASGTTAKEEVEQAYGILRDFRHIGNGLFYTTHRFELADLFAANKFDCVFLEATFDDTEPTFLFKPGVCRYSNASRVAEKIGFSPTDRKRFLMKEGYLKK